MNFPKKKEPNPTELNAQRLLLNRCSHSLNSKQNPKNFKFSSFLSTQTKQTNIFFQIAQSH